MSFDSLRAFWRKKTALVGTILAMVAVFAVSFFAGRSHLFSNEAQNVEVTQVMPAQEPEPPVLSQDARKRLELANWKRPDGPLRVGLQAGHWKSNEVPDELENLKFNGGKAAGKQEWEINLAIAKRAATLLEAKGYVVDVLPATVPHDYYADAFVAIHADVNPNRKLSGYKTSAPWRDFSGQSGGLDAMLDEKYGEETGLPLNPDVSDNMGLYYAFNWRQFEHALHPMTPAAIIETGYMTNASDRRVIFNDQGKAAKGIAEAVEAFLERQTAAQDEIGNH